MPDLPPRADVQLLGEAQHALEAIAQGDWTATTVLAGGTP